MRLKNYHPLIYYVQIFNPDLIPAADTAQKRNDALLLMSQ
jgi:hypothetical protein